MKARYTRTEHAKIVQWSEEDQCFVGTCPELFLGGVHGADEIKVYRELCEAVEECLPYRASPPRKSRPRRYAR